MVSKSGALIKVISPEELILSELASFPVNEKVKVSPSTSITETVTTAVWFSLTSAEDAKLLKIGTSSIGLIVIFTLAVADLLPIDTVYVKASVPLKSASGI